MGWDDTRCEQEITDYTKMVNANRLAAQELIDESAIKARHSIL